MKRVGAHTTVALGLRRLVLGEVGLAQVRTRHRLLLRQVKTILVRVKFIDGLEEASEYLVALRLWLNVLVLVVEAD